MRRALPALLILLSGLLVARDGAAASFDCLEAKAPVEHVICNDPVLNALDDRMAEVYAAQRDTARASQRVWLRERVAACGLPAKVDEPVEADVWRHAGCLVDQYRNRLAALGAPEQVPESGPATELHPLCVAAVLFSDPESTPLDLALCHTGTRHVPVEAGDDGALVAYGVRLGFSTWISVQPVATLPDGRRAGLVHYNGGGTGTFSSIVAYAGGTTPEVELLIGGGDRCNSGITKAAHEAPDWQVSYAVTAADVGAALELPEGQTEDLPFCAICCHAELDVRIAPDGEDQVLAVVRDPESAAPPQDPSRAETCLHEALGPALRTEAAAFPAVRAAFTACMTR